MESAVTVLLLKYFSRSVWLIRCAGRWCWSDGRRAELRSATNANVGWPTGWSSMSRSSSNTTFCRLTHGPSRVTAWPGPRVSCGTGCRSGFGAFSTGQATAAGLAATFELYAEIDPHRKKGYFQTVEVRHKRRNVFRVYNGQSYTLQCAHTGLNYNKSVLICIYIWTYTRLDDNVLKPKPVIFAKHLTTFETTRCFTLFFVIFYVTSWTGNYVVSPKIRFIIIMAHKH